MSHKPTSIIQPLACCAFILLSAVVLALPARAQSKAFAFTQSLQGVTFKVTCPNAGSENKAVITAKGKKLNASVTLKVDGTVTGAHVEDLAADGTPDLVVFSSSAGSGSYGTAHVYSVGPKGLVAVPFPELVEGSKEMKGYMGHDRFAVVERTIVRAFPLYNAGDIQAKPSGKTRQIEYTMRGGKIVMQKSTDM